MAGMRSRYRLRCRASRRKATMHPNEIFTVRRSVAMDWKHRGKVIKCPQCGSDDIVDREETHRKSIAAQDTCFCHGVPHPHRRGTHRLCEHHELADVALTEEEQWQYESLWSDSNRTASR